MKLLIADDDRLILATLGQGLRRAGYEALEASSGREAVELARKAEPDLAILDVRMPDMSGLEVGEELAREGSVPFLFLSAHDDTATVREAIRRGALGYLVKPIDVPQLIPSIEAALIRAGDLRELRESEEKLQGAIVRQRSIAIAVGILMERHRVDSERGFELLRNQARARRVKLEEVASAVVSATDNLNSYKTNAI